MARALVSTDLLPEVMPIPTEGGRLLALFANQDTEVFFDQISPTIDDLARQHAKGVYEPINALRAFQRVAVAAAIVYERLFGDVHMAGKGLSTCFTRLEQEDAGAQLLIMNASVLEEAVWETQKRGCLK